MLYYKDTMQHKAMKLMASKLAVAGIIEGNFSEEGLAAMSDVQDMTSQMAKELMLGIRDNVEDIAASFKKMAILNPKREEPEKKQEPPAPAVPSRVPIQFPKPQREPSPEQEARLAALLEQQRNARKAKKMIVDENQLTLFSCVA